MKRAGTREGGSGSKSPLSPSNCLLEASGNAPRALRRADVWRKRLSIGGVTCAASGSSSAEICFELRRLELMVCFRKSVN